LLGRTKRNRVGGKKRSTRKELRKAQCWLPFMMRGKRGGPNNELRPKKKTFPERLSLAAVRSSRRCEKKLDEKATREI